MPTNELLADANTPGTPLRNQAVQFLSELYGEGKAEWRVNGKKADGYFELEDLGKRIRLYLECKDSKDRLSRSRLSAIWSDYSGIVQGNAPAHLLIVTRNGLSPDAEAFIGEQPSLRHLTIWELEDQVLGLVPYIRSMENLFSEDGLSSYYIEAKVHTVEYDISGSKHYAQPQILFDLIDAWQGDNADSAPIAILGGYGAGKTSFSRRFVSYQAAAALKCPSARRPILIKLGNIARYASLDGLLGAMFTSLHQIRGYSFSRFMEFNRRGRFIIILDGFDEMKHAMSWADFRSQMQELNQLICLGSKVLLLGRPSAFLSDLEHAYILRGQRRVGGSVMDLPDWPTFREFDLAGFSEREVRAFIRTYLAYVEADRASKEQRPQSPEWILSRTEEAESVVAVDELLFSRPVHLRLLADIAASKSSRLGALADRVSRWNLYETFFSLLIERENLKDSRKAVTDDVRLAFIQRIARWLWLERDAGTSFVVDDIPESIFAVLGDEGSARDGGVRRELLSGSFLEKKGGDVFYFPHRSFAEFLVARSMVQHDISSTEHSINCRLFSDGVEEFLRDHMKSLDARAWGETLSSARFVLKVRYLRFLCDLAGSPEVLASFLLPGSHWHGLLRAFGSSLEPTLEAGLRACDELSRAKDLEAALLILLLQPGGMLSWRNSDSRVELERRIAAALLTRIFEAVEPSDRGTRLEVWQNEIGAMLDFARATLIGPRHDGESWTFWFSWEGLSSMAADIRMTEAADLVEDELTIHPYEIPTETRLDAERVLEWLPAAAREVARKFFFEQAQSLSHIFVRGYRVDES